ncbi:hypothetical protein MKEN_00156200 [Mycena kentingensis (nom. inval.)]|nr:hypothetical protein MKEN_00156200 [Mycena kentingensis (nom. inval.)]
MCSPLQLCWAGPGHQHARTAPTTTRILVPVIFGPTHIPKSFECRRRSLSRMSSSSSTPSPPPAGPSVPDTLGALEVGVLLAFILYGTVTVQAYVYSTRFRRDSFTMAGIVAVVWMLETIHTASIGHTVYDYTITHFGDHRRIGVIPTSILIGTIASSFTVTIVQLFFIYRIHILSQSKIFPAFLAFFAFLYLAGILTLCGGAFKYKLWALTEEKLTWLLYAGPSLSAAVDLAVAVTLVSLLLRRRGKGPGFARTRALTDRIIAWTIETGVATSVCSILIVSFFVSFPGTFIWLAALAIKSKLFSNSILASLNSRNSARPGGSEASGQISGTAVLGSQLRHRDRDVEMPTIQVRVDLHEESDSAHVRPGHRERSGKMDDKRPNPF